MYSLSSQSCFKVAIINIFIITMYKMTMENNVIRDKPTENYNPNLQLL